MNSFNIYFFGLICHVGRSRRIKRQAAIVRDDNHFPIIMFGRTDWLPLSYAKRVKLQNVPSGKTETDPLFREYVPSVKTVLGGTLPANVDNATAEDLAIFLKYPEGTLSVFDLYATGARYLVDEEELWSGRVARITGLTTATSEPKVIVRIEGFEISEGNEITIEREVPSSSCILFANISSDFLQKFPEFLTVSAGLQNMMSQPTTPAKHEHGGHDHPQPEGGHDHQAMTINGTPHIQHYGHILDNEGTVMYEEVAMEPETVSPPQCDWVKNFLGEMIQKEVFSSINPECGNTDWP